MSNRDDEFLAAESVENDKIEKMDINEKMKSAFLNYAMSVIIARALPDVRDGLKPVQRRILYGMNELGAYSNAAHKKSARIVGDVMGKYHPHGDSSIYDAMVRLAQPFNYRYTLVDGHGNFGNIDGDGAAASRYTEARMSKISMEMVRDIDKNTVDFIDNYDGTEKEPVILPSRIPNLLVNGSTGIAVGMATNIPPHNLGEIVDGIIALMDNPDIDTLGLMNYIKGPDFPTGGLVLGLTGLKNAYNTGNGIIIIRAKAEINIGKNGKGHSIVVTEIPYTVNKTRLLERIAEVAKEKIVEGITELRDESNDRNGMRVVIELRRDVNPEVMLNTLYKYTQLQISYGINMICLVNNRPKSVSLKEALEEYIRFQVEVVTRRVKFDLEKALARIHILEGYILAQDNINEIIQLIRETTDGTEKDKLIERYNLSEIQAQSILDMQIKRLSGLNKEKIIAENNELHKAVEGYRNILGSSELQLNLIRSELLEIKAKYADPRLSEISLHTDLSIENEDLIPREDVIVTITNRGYAKRMTQDSYRIQGRGGVGMSGIKTNEDDDVAHFLPINSHDYILFFTNKGRVYKIKAYQIPEGSRVSKGIPLVNILHFDEGETLAAATRIRDFECKTLYLFFVTKKGTIKRTCIDQFQNIRSSGIIAMNIPEEDELLQVEVTDGKRDIILGAASGKAIRFNEDTVRAIGRSATGVRGMTLKNDDEIIGMAVVWDDTKDILVVTTKGYGKRSDVSEYRLQARGGMGVKTLNATEKNGRLLALKAVNGEIADLVITTDKGVVIRMHIDEISQTGRVTQGVKLIRIKDDQSLSTIAIVGRPQETELEEVSNDEPIEVVDTDSESK